MKILIVIPDLTIGGAEVTVVNLANNFVQRGHEIFIFECYDGRNEVLFNTIRKEVKIVTYKPSAFTRLSNSLLNLFFGKSKFNNKVYSYFQAKHFNSLVDRNAIEVVNSHLISADFFVYMTLNELLLKKLSWVVSMHGSYENSRKKLPLSEKIFKRVNGVVYLTDRNLNVLDSYKNLNLEVAKIYNCLGDWQLKKEEQVYEIPQPQGNIFTFGLISRGDYKKGWREAIKAVVHLNNEGLECRLILGGDGVAKDELQVEFKEYDFIIFAGFVENPLSLTKEFDVGLLPSYFESLPYTIMEYLYCGIPTIATNVGEVKAMLEINQGALKAGIIVDYFQDSLRLEKDLIDAMQTYILNKDLYKEHQGNTTILYEQFNPQKWGENYLDFYHKVKTKLI